MSLLDASLSDCVLLIRTDSTDANGGLDSTWTDDVTFSAAITLNSASAITRAEMLDMKTTYTVLTTVQQLAFHDVFRRVSDGQIFRVTSDSVDMVAPAMASFAAMTATAERWVLT